MSWTQKLAWGCAALAWCGLAGAVAMAMPFKPIQRIPVLDEQLAGTAPVPKIVKAARITLQPGQPTGAHLHPMTVTGVVTKGSFVFQVEGQPAKTLMTGDAFFEPAGAHILHFDNASQSAPSEIVAFYLTDTAERPLIQMLDPAAGETR